MSDQANAEVGVTEPIVKSGGSSEPVNFDEMEAIMSTPKKTESKVDKALGAKNEPAKGEEKVKAKKKEEPEASEGDPKPAKKVETKKADDAESQEEIPALKTIKVRAGEEDMDLRTDIKVPVKVNGKPETVDLQTLINEFSGKTDWSRKYQTLDTERKTFETERRELQSSIDELYDLAVTQKKPLEAVAYLSDLLGGDGLGTVQQMQQQMIQEFEELSKLSPEEKRARQAEDRAKLVEAKYKNQETSRAKRQEQETVAKRVEDIKAKYGITDDRFKDIYSTLKTNGVKPEELTPEFVGEVHERWLQMDQVDEVVQELGFTENALQVKQALLEEWAKDRSLSKAQIMYIAKQVFEPTKPGSKLKQKIERSQGAPMAPKQPSRSSEHEPVTFDDL